MELMPSFFCQGQSGPGSCEVRGRKRFLDDAAKKITARLEYEKEQWLYIMIPPRSLAVHSNHYIHVLNVLPAAAETSRNNISTKKASTIILGIKHSKAKTHTHTSPYCHLPSMLPPPSNVRPPDGSLKVSSQQSRSAESFVLLFQPLRSQCGTDGDGPWERTVPWLGCGW